MQALFSRVAQVRGSCRCPQCLSAANGVSRRAAGSATRRMPKYLTSSTLWYSGIFAVAATFDASMKIQRREKWDQAIAEVKLDLEQTSKKERRNSLFGTRRETWRDTHGVASAESTPLDSLESEDVFRDVDPQAPRARWPANNGPPLRQRQLAPQSIYATDERRELALSRRWTVKKMAMVHVSIDKLQLKLFLELQHRGWSQEAAKAVPEDYASELLRPPDELEPLLAIKREAYRRFEVAETDLSDYRPIGGSYSLCTYRQDDMGNFFHEAGDLCASLLQLFRLQAEGKITKAALLAKISYNLSICPAPPNINTYNTLLLGLSKMEDSTAFHFIVRSFLETYQRANEVSLVAILSHYTKTNQPKKYLNWIGFIRGKKGGLCLASPDTTINDANRDLLIRKQSRPEKIIQLPYPTPMVFAAIITGVVKFGGFETALKICQNMSEAGWGMSMGGLTPLLRDCALRRDWDAGMAVWGEIQRLKEQSRQRVGERWFMEKIGLGTYGAMLTLCSRCDRKDVFERVWSHAMRAHGNSTDRLLRAVKGQSNFDVDKLMRHQEGKAASDSVVVDLDNTPDVIAQHSDEIGAHIETDRDDQRLEPSQEKEVWSASKVHAEHKPWSNQIRNQSDDRSCEARATDVQDSPSWPLPRHYGNTSSQTSYHPKKSVTWQPMIHEDQLLGVVPSGPELDDYELRERPMAMNR